MNIKAHLDIDSSKGAEISNLASFESLGDLMWECKRLMDVRVDLNLYGFKTKNEGIHIKDIR